MRRRSSVALLLGAAVVLSTPASSRADGPDPSQAAAHVGPKVITVGDLESALASVPPFQLASFGGTPDAVKMGYLDDVLVHDALLDLGAREAKLDERVDVRFRLERALADATRRAVRAEIGPAASIPMDDVRAYYEENRAHFDAPERYGIWRILCKTRDDAQATLDAAQKDGTPATFMKLARERSIDKATYLRGGNLGFVSLDGASNEAGLRVDPAIPNAAATVKDGELVPHPIEEGENFAVVWRRGTIGASHRPVEEAAAQIRDTLWKQRTEAAEKKLEDDLRARNVRDVNEDLLLAIDISTGDGSIVPRRRPGQVPPITQPAPSSAARSPGSK
jgi:peptidyl-prolyl cis-trans isomerase C